jgi:hypothetical protein
MELFILPSDLPTPRPAKRKEMAPQEIDIIQSGTGNGTRRR